MNSNEMYEILDRVRTWDTKTRIDLVQQILETVALSRPPKPTQKMSLDEVVASLKTDVPPPTDEECKKIIEEERIKKYG